MIEKYTVVQAALCLFVYV